MDLRNGKHRLRKVRDMMACDVIQSELYRLGKKRLPANVRDVMAYLLGMPGKPSGVTKIWREGRADAGRRVKHELKKEYIPRMEQLELGETNDGIITIEDSTYT